MASQKQFRATKGTRDILPPDSALWNWFERVARETLENYGFRDVRTPIFEVTDLFARSVGADTDIVSKEMFSFSDHDHEDEAHIQARLLMRNPEGLVLINHIPAEPSAAQVPYRNGVVEFVAAFKRLWDRNEVPRTSENDRALQSLLRLVEDIKTMAIREDAQNFDGDVQGFEKWAEASYREIQKLKLGTEISLRPEATASVCRAYVEHGMQTLPGNVKLYYTGPMFRRERPQKGRYRQFYQIGAEVLGPSDAAGIDAEVIEMLMVLFRRTGLDNVTLYVNSIGHSAENCRPRYVELLREELRKVRDQLGADSQRRIETNPLRVLDSKLPHEQPLIETLPRISDHLCDECRAHFAKLKEELALRGVRYEENWRLVRGLDYYTRTTFEVTAAGLGSQNAVCGGGRYDGLVELLGGPPTKGIGFAIGTDRAILSIQESGKLPHLPGLAVFIAWMGEKAYPTAVAMARKLRDCGLIVELPAKELKFRKSLEMADKLGAKYALIIGDDEVASASYTLKRLADAEQKKLPEPELLEYLESERRGL